MLGSNNEESNMPDALDQLNPQQLKAYRQALETNPNASPESFAATSPPPGPEPTAGDYAKTAGWTGLGAVGGAMMGAPAGPMGMLLGGAVGGGMNALSGPPEGSTEKQLRSWLTEGVASLPEMKLAGIIEKVMKAHDLGRFAKTGIRGIMGMLTGQGNAALAGDQQPGTAGNILNATLPAVAGMVGDRAQKSIGPVEAMRSASGNPNAIGTSEGAQYANMSATSPASAPEIHSIFQGMQTARDTNSKLLQEALQEQTALSTRRDHLDVNLARAKESDKAALFVQRTLLNKQLSNIADRVTSLKDDLTKAYSGQLPQELTAQMSKLDGTAAQKEAQAQIEELQNKAKAAQNGIDPNVPGNLDETDPDRMVKHAWTGPQVNAYVQSINNQVLAQRQVILNDQINRQIQAQQELLRSADTRSSISLQTQSKLNQLQGSATQARLAASAPNPSSAGALKVQTADLKLQQREQQRLVDQLKDSVNNQKNKFTLDPAVADLVNGGAARGNAPTIETFRDNVIAASPDRIDAMYKHMATMPNGDALMQETKNMVISEMFNRAYSTEKGWDFDKMLGPDGDFSVPKRLALFGLGNSQGAFAKQEADRFGNLIRDIQSVQAPFVSWSNMRAGLEAGIIAAPLTAIIPHAKAGAAGLTFASIGISKLVDTLMKNETMYNAFHKWVQSGASSYTIGMSPALNALMNKGVTPAEPTKDK